MAISLSQQWMTPDPALVQSVSVPHTSHWYLLPSWLDMSPSLLIAWSWSEVESHFCCMGLEQQITVPFPPRVTMNSEPHTVQKYLLPV